MSKFDSFFESAPDSQFNKKVIMAAEKELRLNQGFHKRRQFFMFLAPALASVTAILVFKKLSKPFEANDLGLEGSEFMGALIEDDKTLDIVDNMAMLEELDYLEDNDIDSEG